MNAVCPVNILDIETATERVAELWCSLKRCTWELATVLLDVDAGQLWRDAVDEERHRNCTSWSNWVTACTPIHKSTASQLRQALIAVRALPAPEQERWITDTEPLRVYPVRELVASDSERAFELASGGASRGELFDAAAVELPDQHREAGLKRITALVSPSVQKQWTEALNVVRYALGLKTPTDNEIIDAIAAMLLADLNLLSPQAEQHRIRIQSGDWRCEECGSWAPSEWHHTTARSAGGHKSPLALLCHDCHMRIQPLWREWGIRHGYIGEEARHAATS
jgi:hypothetical protein